MPYTRVIPRDLFNEAKLLKCMGQLALILHDGVGVRWPLELDHRDPDEGFAVDQEPGGGGLFTPGLALRLAGRQVKVWTAYNSKDPYPLLFQPWDPGEDEGEVFNPDGTLSAEFTSWLDRNTRTGG